MRPLRGAALALLSSGVFAFGCAPSMPPSLRHSLVGAQAPRIAEKAIGGLEVEVPGGFRSRAFVVDFWASWCEGCPDAIRALEVLWQRYRGDGLRVVAVATDDDARSAAAAAQRYGATFPVVVDDFQQLSGRYRVGQIPLSFVVDAAGAVRWVGRDPEALRAAVRTVLAEPPAEADVF